jgi:hypothetical protein
VHLSLTLHARHGSQLLQPSHVLQPWQASHVSQPLLQVMHVSHLASQLAQEAWLQ